MSALIRFGLGTTGALLLTLGLAGAPASQGGSYVTLGYGESATRTVTLGLASAPAPQGGGYVTLGYGQPATRAAMLGLHPAETPTQGGSYITLGEGQSASKFSLLGLSPGPVAVVVHPRGGGRHIPVHGPYTGLRGDDDMELMLFVVSGALATGMLT